MFTLSLSVSPPLLFLSPVNSAGHITPPAASTNQDRQSPRISPRRFISDYQLACRIHEEDLFAELTHYLALSTRHKALPPPSFIRSLFCSPLLFLFQHGRRRKESPSDCSAEEEKLAQLYTFNS